ncbi:MAG: BlaI/MecI/CopY family transcriptional regulator [Gemmatimonadota bacterium]
MDPTRAEFEILQILWEDGPSVVRSVHERLQARREIGYTTALKLLQNMHQKGFVERDESTRSHIYSPCLKREEVQKNLVADFVDRVFAGSTNRLVVQAISGRGSTPKAKREIRRLLAELEKEEDGRQG